MNYHDKNEKKNLDTRKNSQIKEIKKEQFYPNTYPKELMYVMMNEFGSIIRNNQYSKSESNKVAKKIKKARLAGFFPFCSAHYFKMK